MATRTVNNAVYAALGDRWYDADDDPVALLRAQARLHVPWMSERLGAAFADRSARVLDLGCGGGLVANGLAERGFEVVGVDAAREALDVAARHQTTDRVRWLRADARRLPLEDDAFDAVCAMDFLEHVEPLGAVIDEVARVLVPGGLFFFHTFNRNWLSWLVVIKGVELFVRNVPRDLHLLRAFVKPAELSRVCEARHISLRELHGCAPRISLSFLRMLATGVVPRDFEFHFTRDTLTSYTGIAEKRTRGRISA